jgi:hypothetical protein
MPLSGHVVGLLKEYMRDLVVQAEQEAMAHEAFGFSPASYRSDQAISDLLAILDDRIESEGLQVGLPENFLHEMWSLCNGPGLKWWIRSGWTAAAGNNRPPRPKYVN